MEEGQSWHILQKLEVLDYIGTFELGQDDQYGKHAELVSMYMTKRGVKSLTIILRKSSSSSVKS